MFSACRRYHTPILASVRCLFGFADLCSASARTPVVAHTWAYLGLSVHFCNLQTKICENIILLIFFSGSSGGDLGDVTPCNASPNLSALMTFRPILRDDAEEAWRRQVLRMLNQTPSTTLHMFQRLGHLLRVRSEQGPLTFLRQEPLMVILKWKTRNRFFSTTTEDSIHQRNIFFFFSGCCKQGCDSDTRLMLTARATQFVAVLRGFVAVMWTTSDPRSSSPRLVLCGSPAGAKPAGFTAFWNDRRPGTPGDLFG